MAYQELIKDFNTTRSVLRDFYVQGFHTRQDFRLKSLRSYDNERRRVESWLRDAMGFRQEPEGKVVFLTVDCRTVRHNPLYEAFRAKSFTPWDAALHFLLLDLFHRQGELSSQLWRTRSAGPFSRQIRTVRCPMRPPSGTN